MSVAKLYSRALLGMQALEVTVEVHVASGLPGLTIVGLPDAEIKESRERIRSAIQNAGFLFPARRITINLAPAELPKQSARYDLAMALGILIAANLIKVVRNLEDYEFAGELALDGSLRPIRGALAFAYGSYNQQRNLIISTASASEAALINGLTVLSANNLLAVCDYIANPAHNLAQATANGISALPTQFAQDLKQIKGQLAAKQALEIAAAGRHSLLLIGNPGCGKTMLAERMLTILPPLSTAQALESATLQTLSLHGFDLNNFGQVPFRHPHHSSSSLALIGGGMPPKPGEISLAHHGVLFLDELPEFRRQVLESLREPLEAKKINLSRARYQVEYLADFQLIAAMNPCPCGNLGHPTSSCRCTNEQISRYRAKISGPLLDRIDMITNVTSLTCSELQELAPGEDSATVRARVIVARNRQLARQAKLNSNLSNAEVEYYCKMQSAAKQLLSNLVNKFAWSARSYFRLLKLTQTIADLANSDIILPRHIALASQFKPIL